MELDDSDQPDHACFADSTDVFDIAYLFFADFWGLSVMPQGEFRPKILDLQGGGP
jgi:hypothetical protein